MDVVKESNGTTVCRSLQWIAMKLLPVEYLRCFPFFPSTVTFGLSMMLDISGDPFVRRLSSVSHLITDGQPKESIRDTRTVVVVANRKLRGQEI